MKWHKPPLPRGGKHRSGQTDFQHDRRMLVWTVERETGRQRMSVAVWIEDNGPNRGEWLAADTEILRWAYIDPPDDLTAEETKKVARAKSRFAYWV